MHMIVHVVKIDQLYKYMQKVGEPENDAGFLKHNSQKLQVFISLLNPLATPTFRDPMQ